MKYILSILLVCFSFEIFSQNIDFGYLDLNEIKNINENSENIEFAINKPGNCNTPVEVAPQEAYNFIIEKKPIIIDIRTKEEYDSGHLENVSYNIDFYSPDFKEQLNKLDKNAKYLIYCRTGRRSALTLDIMKELGFKDIHHIKGGIVAWIDAGYPVVKSTN